MIETAEESARLIQAIRSLDEPTRDVFLLRFVEQMPVAEVALAVGEPVGTVKSRLHRGRLRLQKILQSTKERQ
jgi:RNA polymerase sigma-70 factor (ECF subfamily)